MLAIIELASSGLGSGSFPIAVAWRVLSRGIEQHLLIKPAAAWRGWQRDAERVHGVSRAVLDRDGISIDAVIALIERDLGRATVFSDALRLDQAWLDMLFAEAPGTRPPALRRFLELFPGAAQAEIDEAIRQAEPEPTQWKPLEDVRRRALVAERYLAGISRATAPRPRR